MDAVLTRVRAGDVDLDGVDPLLVPLLRAALSPDPTRRPHADDVIAALERYAAGRAATVPPPRGGPWDDETTHVEPPPLPGSTQVLQERSTSVMPPVPMPRRYTRGRSTGHGAAAAAAVRPRRRQRRPAACRTGADRIALRRTGGARLGGPAGQRAPPATTTGTAACRRTRRGDRPARGRPAHRAADAHRPARGGRAGVGGGARGMARASPSSCWSAGRSSPGPPTCPSRRSCCAATSGAVAAATSRWRSSRARGTSSSAVVATAVSLILPVGVALAGIYGSALLLAGTRGGELGPGAPVTLVVGGALGLAMLWWGPGGASLRRGSRSIVRRLVPAGLPMQIVGRRPRDRGCRRGGGRHRQGRRHHVESLLRQSLWRLGHPTAPGPRCAAGRHTCSKADAQGRHSARPKSKETVKCRSRKDLGRGLSRAGDLTYRRSSAASFTRSRIGVFFLSMWSPAVPGSHRRAPQLHMDTHQSGL